MFIHLIMHWPGHFGLGCLAEPPITIRPTIRVETSISCTCIHSVGSLRFTFSSRADFKDAAVSRAETRILNTVKAVETEYL
jgi:hypothetical protein